MEDYVVWKSMHALCVWVTKEKYHSLYMCAIWYLAVRTLGLSPSSDKTIHHDSSFFLSSLSSLGRIHSQPSVSEASQVLTNALAGFSLHSQCTCSPTLVSTTRKKETKLCQSELQWSQWNKCLQGMYICMVCLVMSSLWIFTLYLCNVWILYSWHRVYIYVHTDTLWCVNFLLWGWGWCADTYKFYVNQVLVFLHSSFVGNSIYTYLRHTVGFTW